jgi:hypothetical protein
MDAAVTTLYLLSGTVTYIAAANLLRALVFSIYRVLLSNIVIAA